MKRLPTLFLSHGSPMTAVEPGAAGRAWAALAQALPVPRAVLMVSAHWDTSLPLLTGNAKPETIHDFGGFPDELYALRYPAPGSPDVAQETAALLKDAGFTAGIDGCRGLDHGAWVPLMHMYSRAEVPVVQLSVQTGRGVAHHVHLGAALAPLAGRGVLIVGSGHATHNLRDWMTAARSGSTAPMPYVEAFAAWLDERLAAGDGDALVEYRERRPEAARAHPTEEHYVPLPVAWAAAGPHAVATRFVHESLGGALAMDAWRFDPPMGSGRI